MTQTRMISIRLDVDMYRYLTKLADRYDVSLSEIIREIIRREMVIRADDKDYEIKIIENNLAEITQIHKKMTEILSFLKTRKS